jgi:tetratricopeptide (TPR) repeat protein
MSTENNEAEADADEVCASCGKAEVDDVKLKKCDGCDLVKYCSEECQINHMEQHKKLCKLICKLRLRDKDLFEQPDGSNLGECPICCLPLSLDLRKSRFMPCCSKIICHGCDHTNQRREREAGLEHRCAFCREPSAKSQEESDKRCMKRIKENNDPVAMAQMGNKRYEEGDYETALKYLTKAAELGNAEAHYDLSVTYHQGLVVEKDMNKFIYHSEEAAIAGHHMARHNLGCNEYDNGRFERAVKHFTIAANLGSHYSLELIRDLHADGHARKEDYATALRAYQVVVDATKSAERDEAEAYHNLNKAARGNVSKEEYDVALRKYYVAVEARKRCREGGSN